MKMTIGLLANILLIFILGACSPVLGLPTGNEAPAEPAPNQREDENIVVVTPVSGPNQVNVMVGDVLFVQIPTIPQEGFEWVLVDHDQKVLVAEGAGIYIEDTGSDSAGGVAEFRFAAVGKGESVLNFDYRNESEGVSNNSYSLTVTVSEASRNVVVVTPDTRGPQITNLELGDMLVVQIPTIPQEGYEWVLVDHDQKVLVAEGAGTYVEDTGPDSAGGVVEFRFAAVGKGESVLNFDYRSESQGLSSNSYGLTVIVTDFSQNVVVISRDSRGPQVATLKVGDVLLVEIPTIPEEGFVWTAPYLDLSILIQMGQAEYLADTVEDSSGGVTRLQFEAVGRGEMDLVLEYAKMTSETSDFVTQDSFGLKVVVE
jgi:predicted secreted protein